MPERKAREVQRLQAEGRIVGMVVTGSTTRPLWPRLTSDWPSGRGRMWRSDITLISGALGGLVTAIDLSRATMRNIRQNLIFAFVYNGLGIPIAAGALYPWLGLRPSHQCDSLPEDTMSTTATTIDPVCGMTVAPASASAAAEYEGQTYYFCSKHCHTAFVAEPGSYASPAHGHDSH